MLLNAKQIEELLHEMKAELVTDGDSIMAIPATTSSSVGMPKVGVNEAFGLFEVTEIIHAIKHPVL